MRRGRSSLWPHPLNPPPLHPSTHSPTQTEAQLIVDRGFVGQIVGKGGVNVTAIRTQTGANINTMPPAQRNPLVAPEEQLIKVRGRWEGGLVVEVAGRAADSHDSSSQQLFILGSRVHTGAIVVGFGSSMAWPMAWLRIVSGAAVPHVRAHAAPPTLLRPPPSIPQLHVPPPPLSMPRLHVASPMPPPLPL